MAAAGLVAGILVVGRVTGMEVVAVKAVLGARAAARVGPTVAVVPTVEYVGVYAGLMGM